MSAPSPAVDQPGTATGSDLKGTIVATSLGVPTIPPAQPTPTGPVVPASSPGVTSPLPTLPPVQIPTASPVPSHPRGHNGRHLIKEVFDDDDKGGGKHKHKGNDRDLDDSDRVMTSPLPTLPAVQVSTMTTPAPGQSGGLQSRDLLKEVFDDDDKGSGKHKHKGNDRDLDYSGAVMTSPLPMLPAMQVPTIATLAPSQSGGLNSRDLLKEVFDDEAKGGGKHKHKGNERD